jgi:hypothetical protein
VVEIENNDIPALLPKVKVGTDFLELDMKEVPNFSNLLNKDFRVSVEKIIDSNNEICHGVLQSAACCT